MAQRPLCLQEMDWPRVFLGGYPTSHYLEIAFRSAFMLAYGLAVFRFIGRRTVGKLTTLDLVIVISLGPVLGGPMMGQSPLLAGMVAVTTIALLQRLVATAKRRSPALEALLQPLPLEVARDGKLVWRQLTASDVSVSEVFSMMRQAGVRNLGEVRCACLESSGHLTVEKWGESSQAAGLCLMPPQPVDDDPVGRPAAGLWACSVCGEVIPALAEPTVRCPNCGSRTWVVARTLDSWQPQEAPSGAG